MSLDYERCQVAALLEERSLPAREVGVWLAGDLLPTTSVQAFREVAAQALEPTGARERCMVLVGGTTGAGKTVGAVAALAEVLMQARRRVAGGRRAELPAQAQQEAITPERVRRVLRLDWESFQANEKLQPGVCAAQVRAAYAEEQGWDWEELPLSFAFWDCTEAASADTWGEEFRARKAWARTCDLLVLDDLPDQFSENGPWRGVVDELVNARYSAQLVTLLTTNADKATFLRRYRARVCDRIRGAGVAVWTNEPSLRDKP
jgi:hypothetical protein